MAEGDAVTDTLNAHEATAILDGRHDATADDILPACRTIVALAKRVDTAMVLTAEMIDALDAIEGSPSCASPDEWRRVVAAREALRAWWVTR